MFDFDKMINWEKVNKDLARGQDSELLKICKGIKL